MGATNFETTATGKTLAEAFRNAVDDARYWHGHGGYSGTIAEKPGATEFYVPLADLPERLYPQEQWDRETKSYETVLVAMSPIVRIASAIYWYADYRGRWNAENMEYVECDPFTRDFDASRYREDYKPEWIERDRQRFYDDKEDAKFFVDKMGMRAWKDLCATYDDKWGNAVAIKMDNDEWLFMGLASC